jgi:prepilin-type N-terminal cleavage/methylation domain-containing protein
MKTKKRQIGFTLIEMTVTMTIVVILASIAIGSIIRSQPRFRVRGDVWNVYQTLTKAKFLSIDGSRSFGVMFYHSGSTTGNPDYFFVFQDWNNNGVYDDTDGNPLRQCNPALTSGCLEDPIIGALEPLHPSDFFRSALGTDFTSAGTRAYLTFGPLGNVVQAIGDPKIYIQSTLKFDVARNLSYKGGVKVELASGNASKLSLMPDVMPSSW